RAAELPALASILYRQFERPAGAAAVAGGGDDAFGLKARHQALPAPVLTADQAVGGHADVVEGDLVGPHRAAAEHVEPAQFDARHVVVDEEQGHAVAIVRRRVRPDVDIDDVVAGAGPGCPDLLPAQNVVVAVAP